jgi:hypothetical protein
LLAPHHADILITTSRAHPAPTEEIMSQSDDPGTGSTPHGSTPSGSSPYGSTPYGSAPQPAPQGPTPGDAERPAPPVPGSTAGGEDQGQPAHGQQQYGQAPYGQPQYGQAQYGQPQYGQPQYGHPQYGQTPYGQPSYGQPAYGGQYGQPGYGAPAAYGQYGYSASPARPAHVIVPAILGFIFAAFGVLSTLGVFLGGAAVVGLAGALDSGALDSGPGDPFGGELPSDAAAGIGVVFVVLGLIILAWTVLMIWGSVWALTGRSRVLLLVGGSIAVLVTLIGVLASVLDSTTADSVGGTEYAIGIVITLAFFVASLAIVVPLCLRPATQFFAAHRARRGR